MNAMMSSHTCVISYSTIITLSSEKWPARTQTPPASSSPPWQWGGTQTKSIVNYSLSLSPQSITLHVLYISYGREHVRSPAAHADFLHGAGWEQTLQRRMLRAHACTQHTHVCTHPLITARHRLQRQSRLFDSLQNNRFLVKTWYK